MTRQLLALVLILFLGYGGLELYPVIAGPALSLSSPATFASYPGGVVPVTGKASRVATLTLNGAPLLRDKEGVFSSILTFPHGGSILTFVATDRFGKAVSATREIFIP